MNHLTVNILDLCDEMLLTIFNKLNNIDVLYSFIGVNQKLDRLVRDITFTQAINFVTISSNENPASNTNLILDRFCFDIIPQIQHNIECLTLDSLLLDRVLHVGIYPKLHELTLMNLQYEMASHIFENESSFMHRFKHQIRHLDVTFNDKSSLEQIRNVATNIFAIILAMFTNLTHLDFQLESSCLYPLTSLVHLPSTSCYSSKIVYLNVRMDSFNDCLCLLDGRLSQLHTFIAKIDRITNSAMIINNKKTLSNLKCFSFILRGRNNEYDTRIVPLLQRMSQLEKLTLSFVIRNRTSFIDGAQFSNDVLDKMPHLQTFIFDMVTENVHIDEELVPSSDDIRRTFIQRKHHIDCYMEYRVNGTGRCHIYSLPFNMKRMHSITNSFPGGLFLNVRILYLFDILRPFEHDFFTRISLAFPFLDCLTIMNMTKQEKKRSDDLNKREQPDSINTYPHLTTLYFHSGHIDYIEQFLLDTNTHLPNLKELHIDCEDLIIVTKNFTNNATRANCSKVRHITFNRDIDFLKDSRGFYHYFPLL